MSTRPRVACLLATAVAVMLAASFVAGPAAAGVLAEFFFWDQMGKQAGNAVKNLNDYRRERQLWQDKIAAAQRELKSCGGCAAAQAELDKWQRTENQFKAVAGALAESVGMPPIVAQWLNIPLGLAPPSRPLPEATLRVPDWAKSSPDFCQAAVTSHYSCLQKYQANRQAQGLRTTSYDLDGAAEIGAQCFESGRQYSNCAKEDYDAFAREAELASLRAGGAVIPQLIDESSFIPTVYYSRVPTDFVLEMPPEDVVLAALEEKDVRGIQFIMVRGGAQRVSKVEIAPFFHNVVMPGNRCFDVRSDKPQELERRICEDLIELSWHHRSPILSCTYQARKSSDAETKYFYWYGRRPEYGSLENLLARAHSHAIAYSVGDPRTSCPATVDEAIYEVNEPYANAVAALAARTPQIPESEILPKSEWRQQQQREHDERSKRREQVMKALDTFPIEGVYRIEQTLGSETISGDCVITNKSWGDPRPILLRLGCLDRSGGVRTAQATKNGGFLQTDWQTDTTNYVVDLVAKENGNGDALVALAADDKSASGRLVRKGDIVAVRDILLPGRYRLELSVGEAMLTADCTITKGPEGFRTTGSKKDRKVVGRYWRLPTVCITADGKEYKGKGIPVFTETAMDFHSWWPGHLRVGGKAATNLYFIVDPAERHQATAPAGVIGFADNGVRARLVRISASAVVPPASAVAGLPRTRPPAGASPLAGTWTGQYKCSQGLTSARLQLNEPAGGEVDGTFAFFAHPSNPRVPSGTFKVTGTYDPGSGTVTIAPGNWIDRPAGYSAAKMVGKVSLGDGTMSLRVLLSGCGLFEARHEDSAGSAQTSKQ